MEPRAPLTRIAAAMSHSKRYCFAGASRIARDAGVSKSAVSRLLRGESNPSYALVARLTAALERDLGRSLDPRDLVSESGEWPTPFICEAVGCPGCTPEYAYDGEMNVKPEYAHVVPGRWVGDALDARSTSNSPS